MGGSLRATASDTLEWLSFHRTRLDDHSLQALGKMPNLKRLDLTRTRVSDRSIDYLASIKNLRRVILSRCKITSEGAQRLREKRPDMVVSWEALQ